MLDLLLLNMQGNMNLNSFTSCPYFRQERDFFSTLAFDPIISPSKKGHFFIRHIFNSSTVRLEIE